MSRLDKVTAALAGEDAVTSIIMNLIIMRWNQYNLNTIEKALPLL